MNSNMTRRAFLTGALGATSMALIGYLPQTVSAQESMVLDASGVVDKLDGFYHVAGPQLEHYSSYEASGADSGMLVMRSSKNHPWRLQLVGDFSPRTITDLDIHVRFSFDDAVYDSNGRWYDLVIEMDDFRVLGDVKTELEHLDAMVLSYQYSSNALVRMVDSEGAVKERRGISSTMRFSISSKRGYDVPDGTHMFYLYDLDVAGVDTDTWALSYASDAEFLESITPVSGFISPYYVNEGTTLALDAATGRLHGTRASDVIAEAEVVVEVDIAHGFEFIWAMEHAGSKLFLSRDTHFPGGGGIALEKADSALE